MNKAAAYFLGKHDFKAFTTARKSKSTEREIKNITISCDESGIVQLRITANDFLHNMARLMIGILLDVGAGKCTGHSGWKRCSDVTAGRKLWTVFGRSPILVYDEVLFR